MKFSIGVSLLASGAAAFPAAVQDEAFKTALESRQVPGVYGTSKTFSEKQHISTSGVHKFVPPDFAKGDKRGPCPGLNALANHGYLPHNGIGTIAQYTAATNQVLGMGLDVSTVFATYGALVAGDGISWSMGGPPDSGLASLAPGLLGAPKGISFSHNEYEGDGSATRNDFYLAGDDYKLNMDYFKELYNVLPADNFETLVQHRSQRIKQAIATNPYYFNGPFTGIAIAAGANSFVFRLAANCSKEYPQGYLSKETFASFWGVKGKGKNMYWEPGHDRIPENWYRRPFDDEYSLAFAGIDLARYIAENPDAGTVGGNTGKVNTFTGVRLTDLTGGVFSGASLLEGNNAACFAYQVMALGAPDVLSKVFKSITGPLAKLNKATNNALAPLTCPQLTKLDTQGLKRFPGYKDPKAHA